MPEAVPMSALHEMPPDGQERDPQDATLSDDAAARAQRLLNQRRLGVAPTALVASPAYLERQGWPQAPADLSGLALLMAELAEKP